jgi:predicted GIY-YIG superfamily endonuclease
MLQGSSGRHYLGSTSDLQRRLAEHRRGHTHTTRRLGDSLLLLDAAKFPSLQEARAWERKLKRKKNPRLALELLRQLRSSSPR